MSMDWFTWFLMGFFSNLMLPLFMVALLCLIAGARPEPIIVGMLSLLQAAVIGLIRLLITLVGLFRAPKTDNRRKPSPRKS